MLKSMYKDIVCQNPQGQLLSDYITQNFDEWTQQLHLSGLFRKAATLGYPGSPEELSKWIYASCVWGFGFKAWTENDCNKYFDTYLKKWHLLRRTERKYIGSASRDISLLHGGRVQHHAEGIPQMFFLFDQWLQSVREKVVRNQEN